MQISRGTSRRMLVPALFAIVSAVGVGKVQAGTPICQSGFVLGMEVRAILTKVENSKLSGKTLRIALANGQQFDLDYMTPTLPSTGKSAQITGIGYTGYRIIFPAGFGFEFHVGVRTPTTKHVTEHPDLSADPAQLPTADWAHKNPTGVFAIAHNVKYGPGVFLEGNLLFPMGPKVALLVGGGATWCKQTVQSLVIAGVFQGRLGDNSPATLPLATQGFTQKKSLIIPFFTAGCQIALAPGVCIVLKAVLQLGHKGPKKLPEDAIKMRNDLVPVGTCGEAVNQEKPLRTKVGFGGSVGLSWTF
jgi:hypothetical protein